MITAPRGCASSVAASPATTATTGSARPREGRRGRLSSTSTPARFEELDAWVGGVHGGAHEAERSRDALRSPCAARRSRPSAGAAAWVVSAEPRGTSALRYPLRYEAIVRGHARNYDLDPDAARGGHLHREQVRPRRALGAGRGGADAAAARTPRAASRRAPAATAFVVDDLLDPEINVRYGSWYLRHLLDRYDDELRTALAAYHAGPGNVDRWRREGSRDPVSRDARTTSSRVLDAQRVYASAYADELG